MHQSNLFGSNAQTLDLIDADLHYWPEFIDADEQQNWFDQLQAQTPWQQHRVRVFAKTHLAPRLSHWVGDDGANYTYSNQRMRATPWTPVLKTIKKRIEAQCNAHFNSVLLNLYRDGRDSNGWHSDDEPELGTQPSIASLSLGAARDFHLRHKQTRHTVKLSLAPGSLLLMQGPTQDNWQHQIPKRAHAQPRINLTFRHIYIKP